MTSDPPLHVALGPHLRRPSVRLLKEIRERFSVQVMKVVFLLPMSAISMLF